MVSKDFVKVVKEGMGIPFEEFRDVILNEFYDYSRNFKIMFWLMEKKEEKEKHFVVTVQSSSNNEPDDEQFILSIKSYDEMGLKFQKGSKQDLKDFKKILDWKLQTRHQKEQLPALNEVIKDYLL